MANEPPDPFRNSQSTFSLATGDAVPEITYTADSRPANLPQHQSSRDCKKVEASSPLPKRRNSSLRISSGQCPPVLSAPPLVHPAPPWPWYRSPSPDIHSASSTPPPSEPAAPLMRSPRANYMSPPVAPKLVTCCGMEIKFPVGQNHHVAYPFGLHSTTQLPWNYYSEGDRFYVRSTACSKVVPSDVLNCQKCRALKSNDLLRNVLDRIKYGVNENTPLFFYGIGGLVTKLRRKNDQIQVLRLTNYNDTQRLSTQSSALDRHKQFVMAVGSGKVPRIAALVTASRNNNEGLDALLERLFRGASDAFREGPAYNPKGFTPDERMLALCVLRVGGSRLADILHRALGLPGLTTLRKHRVIRPLRASPKKPTVAEIEENIDAYTEGEELPVGKPTIVHRVIMLDEIAVERRPRWDDKTNMILGACREHSAHVPLEFCEMKDAEMFFHEYNAGRIHLASEATVAAFGALSRDPRMYNPLPICISGTCKSEKGPEQADFLRVLNAAGNNRKQHGNIMYRTVSFASDGEAKRGLALAIEFMKFQLDKLSPIYPQLAPLQFMNLQVGPDDITPDKDFRHIMKTTRSLLMRNAGIELLGYLITPSVVKKHLMAEGNSQSHVDTLLNPNDTQDVYYGFQLLKELWSLPDAAPGANPLFSRARQALQTFGRLGYHLVMPYICLSLSLREQLVHLSTAAHLLLILFATDRAGTKFMANQTFVNIMIMIKNAFFCVAKAKIDIPDSEFFLILLGTDRLEKLFGLIRTAVGTDVNVDIYQLSTRASNLTEVSVILAKRPHWDRGPRRLKLPAVINENGDVSAKADHVSPASWLGDLHVANVVLHSCWMEGRLKAEAIIPGGREFLKKCAQNPSFDIFTPLGHSLVRAVDERPEAEPFYDAEGDIEDEIAFEMPQNKSPHIITTDGKTLSKASILSQMMLGGTARLSTDRIRRVAGFGAFKAPSANGLITTDTTAGAPSLRIGNPIAALVSCEEKIYLAVGQVNRILFGTQFVDELVVELLPDQGTKISFQILRLLPATHDDNPDGQYDWRWSLAFESTCSNVPGTLIRPLNPTISNRVAGAPTYLFSSDVLIHVASGINSQLASVNFPSIPAVTRSEKFPYRHGEKACFVVEPDDSEYRGKLAVQESLDCNKCSPAVPVSLKNKQLILQHNGAHILFDPSIRRSDEPCGLCLRPFPLCTFFLTAGTGTDSARQIDWKSSTCLRRLTFSMAAAMKWSPASPCTNYLIRCPLQCGTIIWTYNIEAHCRSARHGLVSLNNVGLPYATSTQELSAMKKLWKNRQNYPRTRFSSNISRPALRTSDAHSSRLAYRTIADEDPSPPQDESTGSNEEDDGVNYDDAAPPRGRRARPVRVDSGSESGSDHGAAQGPTSPDSDDDYELEYAEDPIHVPIPASTHLLPPLIEDDIDRAIEHYVLPVIDYTGHSGTAVATTSGSDAHNTDTETSSLNPNPPGNTPLPTPSTVSPMPIPQAPTLVQNNAAQTATGRPQRNKRKVADRENGDEDPLKSCDCGLIVAGVDATDPLLTIRCNNGACQTIWYHSECVGNPAQRKNWVCGPCGGGKRRRAQ
ncbi:hypothetical protein C8R47DRAFT_1132450 [Mycena vitilis]|nr:hypothetical protein C8R47DRAFT_1132450 [Mycena vitilis]